MITVKQGILLSAIVDKMGLEVKTTKKVGENEVRMNQDEVGANLIMQIIRNVHKSGNEFFAFVASVKGCSKEEAENVDLVKFFKEDLFADSDTLDFLKSAVTSKVQDS